MKKTAKKPLPRSNADVLRLLVTIDPGASGTGVAVFNRHDGMLKACRVFDSKKISWRDRCNEIVESVDFYVRTRGLTVPDFRILCEYPAFFPTAAGMTSARSGALVKLAYLCGRFDESLQSVGKFELVAVAEWKGQASKDIINSRIAKQIPESVRSQAGMSSSQSHDWDAVGIGLWWLKQEKSRG